MFTLHSVQPLFFCVTTAHQDVQILANRRWHEIGFMHLWMRPASISLLCLVLYIGQDQAYNVFTRDFNSCLHSAESLPHSLLDKDRWSLSLHGSSPVCLWFYCDFCAFLIYPSIYLSCFCFDIYATIWSILPFSNLLFCAGALSAARLSA